MKKDNIGCAYLYFYIHFIVEVACFYYLGTLYPDSKIVWLIPLIYDAFAFVPQGLIGYFKDKYPKCNLGIYGVIFLIISIILKELNIFFLIPLILLCIGNMILHIEGAEVTLKNSDGNLSHPAIFVAGGSFGVITGKILAMYKIPAWFICLLVLTIIPAYLLANEYKNSKIKPNLKKYNYANKSINPIVVILLAIFVVIVRGYIGYGIPTSWNKTLFETIIFYVTMGMGKALGGILSDKIGFRKVAFISTIISIPFLCFGNNIMLISLIGIMLFSMTMSLTLGILASVLKKNPGLAFGLTTIGLFIGTCPIFFIRITNFYLNIVMIIVSSIMCYIMLRIISNKEVNNENNI